MIPPEMREETSAAAKTDKKASVPAGKEKEKASVPAEKKETAVPEITEILFSFSDDPDVSSVLDHTDIRTRWCTILGKNLEADSVVMVDGKRKSTRFDPMSGTLGIKLLYSDWCGKEHLSFQAGKPENGKDGLLTGSAYDIPVVNRRTEPYEFDYGWTKWRYVMHAGGEIDGVQYTNSLEAFTIWHAMGQRLFEADFAYTSDGRMILSHDWGHESMDTDLLPISWDAFSKHKEYAKFAKYTRMSAEDLCRFMSEHPDVYVVTDSKYDNSEAVSVQFSTLVEIAKNTDPEILDRLVVQVYNEAMFWEIMNIYPFRSVIYTLYKTKSTGEELYAFIESSGIGVVTATRNRISGSGMVDELQKRGCRVYIHTVNQPEEVEIYAAYGIYGFYTDRLFEDSVGVDIGQLNREYFAEDPETRRSPERAPVRRRNYSLLKKYMGQLDNDRYLTVLAAKGDVSSGMTEELGLLLGELGIPDNSLSEAGSAFLAVIDRGRCVFCESGVSPVKARLWADDILVDAMSTGSSPDLKQKTGCSIKIDGKEYAVNRGGLNIVVYDTDMGVVLDSVVYNMAGNYACIRE